MSDRRGLEDFDFSQVKNVTQADIANPAHGVSGMLLFRFVEDAPVVLYRHCDDSAAQLVIPRYDRFQYEGGFAWGYSGTGPQCLSHALAALIYPAIHVREDQAEKAIEILDKVVSRLPADEEMDLPVVHIYERCGTPELVE
ncbi:DUF6166 domain-containing protein [Halomonas elongata]|uniref:DUF6166 domain-containing protein n=1 Tax=Halomonas elongata TaxID=2746 RepID=UPI0023AF5F0D|nr:DUF6166 domain-containing protein [Halomonas elongata]